MARIKALGLEFEHSKFDGLDGKTKEQWSTPEGNLVFTADQQAVQIKGTLRLETELDLQNFAKFLGQTVWPAHRRLVPKIHRPGEQ